MFPLEIWRKHIGLGAAGSLTGAIKRDPAEEQGLETEGPGKEERREGGDREGI